jgi:hypothetical protein
VRLLARRFGKDVLLARAAQIHAGFDIGTPAGMIATLDRFADDEIPVPEGSSAAELRALLRSLAIRADEAQRRLTSIPGERPLPQNFSQLGDLARRQDSTPPPAA